MKKLLLGLTLLTSISSFAFSKTTTAEYKKILKNNNACRTAKALSVEIAVRILDEPSDYVKTIQSN